MNITKNDIADYNNMCPICFETIDKNILDSYIILDCCEQSIHLNCIIDWNKSNFVKKVKQSVGICVWCRQNNEFLSDVAREINQQQLALRIDNGERDNDDRDNDADYPSDNDENYEREGGESEHNNTENNTHEFWPQSNNSNNTTENNSTPNNRNKFCSYIKKMVSCLFIGICNIIPIIIIII